MQSGKYKYIPMRYFRFDMCLTGMHGEYANAFERIWDGERGQERGEGDRSDKRGMAFGCIFMLSGAFWTEREGHEKGQRDRGT